MNKKEQYQYDLSLREPMVKAIGEKKYNCILQSTMIRDIGLDVMRRKTLELIKSGIKGDIVECGVWMGGSSAMIAQTLLENNDIRVLRLFDSFNDPPEPTTTDGARAIKQIGGLKYATGKLQPVKGFYKKRGLSGPGNAKHAYNLLTNVIGYPKDKVKIYKGWFQNTLAPYSKRIEKIAWLILDCDLYASIKICLEYLYDKLVPDGEVMIDDYFYYDGAKLAVDEFLKNNNINKELPANGYMIWKK